MAVLKTFQAKYINSLYSLYFSAFPESLFTASSLDDEIRPDMILVNGKIVTVDRQFSIAEAVAIKGDRIFCVGRSNELKKLKGINTKIIDLKNRTVVPGFIDSHVHMLDSGLKLTMIDIESPNIKSVKDLVRVVGEKTKSTPKGEWIIGSGWDPYKYDENISPTRWDLDKICPDNPVYLMRYCGHVAVANSKALEIAGIDKNTPQPNGGEIVKDDNGEPTGLLLESPGFEIVSNKIPDFSLRTKAQAIKAISKKLTVNGITSVIDPGYLKASITQDDIRIYQEVLKDGDLTVRVNAMIRAGIPETPDSQVETFLTHFGPRTGLGDEFLKVGGIKIFVDGIIGAMTAHVRKPFIRGKPGNYGMMVIPLERLRNFLKLANRMGWQVGAHIIGGRAIDNFLEACKEANKESAISDKRWFILHCMEPSLQNIEDMRSLGIAVATTPQIIYNLSKSIITNKGKEWTFKLMPHKDCLNHGVMLCANSDSPVNSMNPLLGIYALVLRKSREGDNWGQDQCISVQDALKAYTLANAWLSFEEKKKGSIERGKLADMVILSEDLFTIDAEKIKDINVIATILGGEVIYCNPEGDLNIS